MEIYEVMQQFDIETLKRSTIQGEIKARKVMTCFGFVCHH